MVPIKRKETAVPTGQFDQNIERGQSLELKKHINAIHCTNNLSLIQRKLFNALLYNAYVDLPNKSQFEIPARSLCNLIGYNSNDYAKLKKALLGLMTVAIEWNVIDYTSTETKGRWQASSALSSAKLEQGLCTYEYSILLRELLYHPEIYGRLNMSVLAKFNSSYGIALYENCIRFQGLPQTPWFAIDVFRKLMGVGEDKYGAFKDFKKRVLNIAVDEVNAHAPIMVVPELKRKNQQVVSIRFILSSKLSPPLNKSIAAEDSDDCDLINTLANDFYLSPEAIKDLLSRYSFSYIRDKVTLILNSESFRAGKIRGVAGYLIDALKKDYQSSRSSTEILENERKVKTVVKPEPEDKKEELYQQYLSALFSDYIFSLSPEQLQKLVAEFGAELKTANNFAHGWLQKYGLEHRGVRALFHDFLRRVKTQELGIKSFSDFCEND